MTQIAYPGAVTEEMVSSRPSMPSSRCLSVLALQRGYSAELGRVAQHAPDLCAKFAAHGYVAIAPDMSPPAEGDQAALNRGDISVPLTDADLRPHMSAGRLSPRSFAGQGDQIAAMGVCQSGSYPLQLNSVRPEIAANIVMYGGAQKGDWQLNERRHEPYEDALARLTAPVLGIFGEKDFLISVEDVFHLASVLMEKRKSFEIKIYPEMPHGWMNDTMPGRYRQKEAEEAGPDPVVPEQGMRVSS
jgi:carboxymethylenebutenolidase